VKQAEVLSSDGILVTLAQKAKIVAGLQFLNAGGEAPEFLIVPPERACVLGPTVHEFFFPVALDFVSNPGKHRHGGDGQNGGEEQQRQKNVTVLSTARTA
jgi:hypothetical protein